MYIDRHTPTRTHSHVHIHAHHTYSYTHIYKRVCTNMAECARLHTCEYCNMTGHWEDRCLNVSLSNKDKLNVSLSNKDKLNVSLNNKDKLNVSLGN
jgi:hypothetical protein